MTFGFVYEQKYDDQRLVEEITENTVGKFVDPSMKSMARRVVAITARLTNSPELNNNALKEGLLERMMGMARSGGYLQPLGASKAIIAASSKKKGVMFNKYVTHPKMKRRIEKPLILLLDGRLEYKNGESQTIIEVMKEDDFSKILEQGEAHIKKIGDEITASKPDLVIAEKGGSDLAQHFGNKAGGTAVRRIRKIDNQRVARAGGATIINKADKITEEDIGTGAGLFKVRKIGDEGFTFIEQCKDPKSAASSCAEPARRSSMKWRGSGSTLSMGRGTCTRSPPWYPAAGLRR